MPIPLTKRIALGWLFLSIALAGALLIVLKLAYLDADPVGAVLISRAEDATPPVVGVGRGGGLVQASAAATSPPPSATATTTPALIVVYVSGAVKTPGLVTLSPGARLADALAAAGGPTANADVAQLNLALHISDEQQIVVPVLGSPSATTTLLRQAASPRPTRAPVATPSAVNLNTANAAAFETLPGIGPALAARIVADREKNGPFARPEDIMRVPGIKSAIYAKIKDRIFVAP
jgi:competence protein ComEA